MGSRRALSESSDGRHLSTDEWFVGSASGLYHPHVAALTGVGLGLSLGPLYWVGVALVAALLVYEQRLVSATDLSRVDAAFFSVNGVIAMLYTAAVVVDVAVR